MDRRSGHLASARRGPDLSQLLVLALLVGTPAGLFVALREIPSLDVLFQSLIFHLVVVSAISGCALVVAVLAAVAAGRTQSFALVMLALGCLSFGFFMLGHGLTTPVIGGRPLNMWIARFPVLALTAMAVCLGAALLPREWAVPRFVERHIGAAILGTGTILALACSAAVVWPAAWIGGHPLPGESFVARTISLVSAVILVVAGEVHRRRWRLSHDKVEVALLLACWLSAESVVSLQFGRLWRLSWWDYHVLLLVGFAGAVYAVLAGYRRSRTVQGALNTVILRDTLHQIQNGYPDSVRSLITAVEARDSYTQGHSDRVALLSVRIGEHLGLRANVLRSLAQGGHLHDIGKIGVPDSILNKPGLLTAEERAEIERHPTVGWDIVRNAPSLRGARAVVRHHHERMDGTGYPDHLKGLDIPLEARIAAVADVWDAVTSDRAYRLAWPHDRALELMLGGRGTHFDPDPLDALLELLDAEGIRLFSRPSPGAGTDLSSHPARSLQHGVAMVRGAEPPQ